MLASASYLPSEPQDEDGNPVLVHDGLSRIFPGWSELLEEMARNVETIELTRPAGGKLNKQSSSKFGGARSLFNLVTAVTED